MATAITDDRITSDQTSHTAFLAAPGYWETGWIVTWTGKTFASRNQAITAVTAAEVFAEIYRAVAEGAESHRTEQWPLFADLVGELDMTPDEAWRELADTYPPLS